MNEFESRRIEEPEVLDARRPRASLLRRRDLLLAGAALPIGTGLFGRALPPFAHEAAAQAQDGAPFGGHTVRELARRLAAKPFEPADTKLPPSLQDIDYDRHRSIRFIPDRALWRGEDLPFQAQLFHRGWLFKDRIDIFIVADGEARRLRYSPDLFSFGPGVKPPPADADLGFAGFRLHGPINRDDYFDEVAVFLGASYFRSLAKGQVYGLSARGFSIKTADPSGEEFPLFRSFWIERPRPGTNSIVVHALLDSESAAAAYRFTIRFGETTVFDVESAVYPRLEVSQAGLATLTSMFFFNEADRAGVDDFRPSVHDSDGLLMLNGRGEQLWRPLANPTDLQLSAFQDLNPRGFGLMQRERAFHDYEDLEARYERRPSCWVEPIGDWGEGAVQLIEIPTRNEVNDNIVAFWRPREPMRPGAEYIYTYRLHWGWGAPSGIETARVMETRTGVGTTEGARLFVLDFKGGRIGAAAPETLRAEATATEGKIQNLVLQRNPELEGWRLSFELAPDRAGLSELRAQLLLGKEPVSEAWIYRWTR